MCGVPVRKSCRRVRPVDYLVNKKTADWSPSTCAEVQRVNSDSRRAEVEDEAAHFQEEDAKREGLSLHVRPGGSVLYRGYAYQPPAALRISEAQGSWCSWCARGLVGELLWAGSPLGAHRSSPQAGGPDHRIRTLYLRLPASGVWRTYRVPWHYR